MRERLIGKDPIFRSAVSLARKAAASRSPLLIQGAMGTGKSHLARWVHGQGSGADAPFLEWNVSSVPESLFESEFLGVEPGTATGVEARAGGCESVESGTLCLTGLELLPQRQQAVLLRVLEERSLLRVGGQRPRTVNARFIALFQENPDSLSARGLLRRDLLYRLDVIRIDLPPLGLRRGDVPLLLHYFMRRALHGKRKRPPELSGDLLEALRDHAWPGNLRELAQIAEALALGGDDRCTRDHLPASFWLRGDPLAHGLTQRMTLAELKDAYIRHVLARVDGNRTRAANWLGISRKALWEHLKRR